MKFSGKMSLMIILKVTKNQGFTLSLGDIFSQKPQEGSAVLGIRQGEGEGGERGGGRLFRIIQYFRVAVF